MCSLDDTWWKQICNATGMELCVNNSWAGSLMCGNENDASIGAGSRAINLHNDQNGDEPDIITIFLGTNDYDTSAKLGSFKNLDEIYSNGKYVTSAYQSFLSAYAIALDKIQKRYPNADIFLCTVWKNNERKDYETLNKFNDGIKDLAKYFNCNVVNFADDCGFDVNQAVSYSTKSDGIHPNRLGHDAMSNCFINKLESIYVK